MIKFENTEIFNFEAALRGMRNPFNSWNKSDSYTSLAYAHYDKYDVRHIDVDIGENDLVLAQRLVKSGSDHRKFLRQIFISVDITAPFYWWKEFDTYKVGTVANSCSTMHKIADKDFTLDDFSHEHLNSYGRGALEALINVLNEMRSIYLNGFKGVPGDDSHNVEPRDKRYWWQLIQLLPSSYNQRRTVTLNYEVLRNIYHSRKGHKLDEWSIGFIDWIKTLPYAEELIVI